MNVDGPVASRRVVFSVGDRADEAAAAWRWAASNFLEPKKDRLTLLHIHTGGVAALAAKESVSAQPLPWVPAEAAKEWGAYSYARAVDVNSPLLLPIGDALIDWLTRVEPGNTPDVVITGSRGHDSRMARFFLGSVSSYLVQNSSSTVLVVRPPAQEAAMAEPLRQPPPPEERGAVRRKVALALDPAADTARAQIRWAIKYVLHTGDEVKLLHGPTKSGEMKTRHDSSAYTAANVVLRAAADTIAPYVSPHIHPVAVMFTSGLDVRDEITDYVNKNAIDLVIVGRRSLESKVRRPAVGSVSSYILHHAACAVMVVNEATLHAGLM